MSRPRLRDQMFRVYDPPCERPTVLRTLFHPVRLVLALVRTRR